MKDKWDITKTQCDKMESGRKMKKVVNGKVGYERALMTGPIKERNLQSNLHYELERTKS
jgi:hypothetical protein